ncbi:MAG: hypothetical protein M0P01_04755 [Treponema sp.]|nr:hypothetical protein [Treponema sp.]
MKRMIFIPAAAIVFICSLAAQQSVKESLPALGKTADRLISGELLSSDNADGTDITRFAPEGSLIAKKLAAAPAGVNGFAVTSVSVVPYPDSWNTMSSDECMLALYNILCRISSQKGITYISRRAGYKPKVLFDQSYYISGPDDDKTVLPDPVVSELPSSETRWVYQSDTSFGGTIYQYTYTTGSSEILLKLTNHTPMKYHGITCLKENELSMYISVYPASDGIILNSTAVITGHKTHVKILFLDVDLSDSFRRRTEALHTWYKNQLRK